MKNLLNFLLISSLTGGAVTSSSTNLFNINNQDIIKSENHIKNSLMSFEQQNLKFVITERDLGDVIIPVNASDDARYSAIMNALLVANPNLNISEISLEMIDDYGAIVVANPGSKIYVGSVSVDYSIVVGQKLSLDIVLQNSQLGEIKSSNSTPSADEIKIAVKKLNKIIQIDHIIVKYITADHAIIVGDNVLYTGNVSVSFYTTRATDLSKILTTTDLGLVYFDINLNEKDLLVGIKAANNSLNTNGVMALKLENNSAVIMGDGLTYIGKVKVTFKTVFKTPLSQILTVLDLKIIKISQRDHDINNHISRLMRTLVAKNDNLDVRGIVVQGGNSSITASSTTAVIKGIAVDPSLEIQNVYTGSVTIKFSFQIVQKF